MKAKRDSWISSYQYKILLKKRTEKKRKQRSQETLKVVIIREHEKQKEREPKMTKICITKDDRNMHTNTHRITVQAIL